MTFKLLVRAYKGWLFAALTGLLLVACGGGGETPAPLSSAKLAAYSLAVEPQTGIWWNPAESGRGYAIERQGTMVTMGAYMYEASGVATWYLAVLTRQSDGSYIGAMTRYAGGQTLAGAYKAPTSSNVIANVTLSASTATAASLSVQPTDGSPTVVIPIERFSFYSSRLIPPGFESGIWWSESESGRGYFVDVQGSKTAIAAYMYDASGQPVWYLSVADVGISGSFKAAMQPYSSGQTLTGAFKAATPIASPGQMTFTATSSTTANLTLPNGNVVPLKRFIFNVTPTPCAAPAMLNSVNDCVPPPAATGYTWNDVFKAWVANIGTNVVGLNELPLECSNVGDACWKANTANGTIKYFESNAVQTGYSTRKVVFAGYIISKLSGFAAGSFALRAIYADSGSSTSSLNQGIFNSITGTAVNIKGSQDGVMFSTPSDGCWKITWLGTGWGTGGSPGSIPCPI